MKYSPLELDQMRNAIYRGEYEKGGAQGHYSTVSNEQIERLLLTHMANGTKLAELEAWASEMEAQAKRAYEWRTAEHEANQRYCQHRWSHEKIYDFGVDKGWRCVFCGLMDRRMSPRDRRSGKSEKPELVETPWWKR